MKHFHSILVTTDLSPESFSTVHYALHLAKSQGATLSVLHVLETTTLAYVGMLAPTNLDDLHRELAAAAKSRLDDWAVHHGDRDVATTLLVRDGNVHDTICSVAREIDASIVVMATHGRRGFGHAFLGSVTERVLREAPCPVLVVRPPRESERQSQAS